MDPLTDNERVAILGMQARDRELVRTQAELYGGWRHDLSAVEQRLGLPAGALGTTHFVRADT